MSKTAEMRFSKTTPKAGCLFSAASSLPRSLPDFDSADAARGEVSERYPDGNKIRAAGLASADVERGKRPNETRPLSSAKEPATPIPQCVV